MEGREISQRPPALRYKQPPIVSADPQRSGTFVIMDEPILTPRYRLQSRGDWGWVMPA